MFLLQWKKTIKQYTNLKLKCGYSEGSCNCWHSFTFTILETILGKKGPSDLSWFGLKWYKRIRFTGSSIGLFSWPNSAYRNYYLSSVRVCLYHLFYRTEFLMQCFMCGTYMYIYVPCMHIKCLAYMSYISQFDGHICFWHIFGNNMWRWSLSWLCLGYMAPINPT